jgi:hypothetical protein
MKLDGGSRISPHLKASLLARREVNVRQRAGEHMRAAHLDPVGTIAAYRTHFLFAGSAERHLGTGGQSYPLELTVR